MSSGRGDLSMAVIEGAGRVKKGGLMGDESEVVTSA